MSYHRTANTNADANTQDREEVGRHAVHFLPVPARRKAARGGLLPPYGVVMQVGAQVARTPPLAVALLGKHYSSSGGPEWNCERNTV